MVMEAADNVIYSVVVLEQLVFEPTLDKLGQAIDTLSSGKSSGCNGVSLEVNKCGKFVLLRLVLPL